MNGRRPNPHLQRAGREIGGVFGLIHDFMVDPEGALEARTGGDEDAPILTAAGETGPACRTCADRRVLGRPGAQVPCPVCSSSSGAAQVLPACATCGDTRELGAPGARIPCPLCAPRASGGR